MINILLPSMGTSAFFKDNPFPKPLIEINKKTILEHIVENYNSLKEKRFIFVFSANDCREFHLDTSCKLLCENCDVIQLRNQTSGALCTCLMTIDYINNDTPLIIANSDQVIDVDYGKVINYFNEQGVDSGIITFTSIHPRWSYAKKFNGEIVEVAEKRPLSKDAIAGFYYFKSGRLFIQAAKRALQKRNELNGKYYISATINEIILMNKKVGYYGIDASEYHSLYTPEKIKEYEREINKK